MNLAPIKQMLISSVSLLRMKRQRERRDSVSRLRAAWMVASNISTQCKIFRVLASPSHRDLVFTDPRFPFKYAITNYLAQGLTTSQRAECFLYHHCRVNAAFPVDLLRHIFERNLTLHEVQHGANLYSIELCLPTGSDLREGELAIEFRVDGVTIYVLQLTVIPGRVVGSKARDVVLISRIQGVRGCYPLIYSATKAFRDVAPAALLVGAAHGVAQALEIDEWAGVTSERQTCFGLDRPDMFSTAYDEFFAQLGGTCTKAGFFLGSFSEQKPLGQVNNGHKARKKKRRAIRLQLANDVAALIFWRCAEFSVLPGLQAPELGVERQSETML